MSWLTVRTRGAEGRTLALLDVIQAIVDHGAGYRMASWDRGGSDGSNTQTDSGERADEVRRPGEARDGVQEGSFDPLDGPSRVAERPRPGELDAGPRLDKSEVSVDAASQTR